MSRPNLFKEAATELSQEAFIVWLAKWASPGNESIDQSLHKAGQKFLRSLLAVYDEALAENITFDKVEAGRRIDNIDAWVEVNDTIFIMVEKQSTSFIDFNVFNFFAGSFDKYKSRNGKTWETVVAIYLKMEDKPVPEAEKPNFYIYTRADFLSALEPEIDNVIYADFRESLIGIEEEAQEYKNKDVESWGWSDIQRFYADLRPRLKRKQRKKEVCKNHFWFYKASPAGGSLDFYLAGFRYREEKCFLSLYVSDARKIVIKASEGQDSQDMARKIDTAMIKRIFSKLEGGLRADSTRSAIKLSKPERQRTGYTAIITDVCRAGQDTILATNADGTVNMEETVKFIQQVEELLLSACPEP